MGTGCKALNGMTKQLYLGGCVWGRIRGENLLVKCWTLETTSVVSYVSCMGLNKPTKKSKEKKGGDTTSWNETVNPGTFFALDIQGQLEVVCYWDGTTVQEVTQASGYGHLFGFYTPGTKYSEFFTDIDIREEWWAVVRKIAI